MIVSSCRILPLFMRDWPMIFNTSNSMITVDYKNINTGKISAFKLKNTLGKLQAFGFSHDHGHNQALRITAIRLRAIIDQDSW